MPDDHAAADAPAADHSTDFLAPAHVEPDPTYVPAAAPEPAATATAADRLKAFEDEHFGSEAVRINGRIERGSGSPYQAAPEEIRRQHQAIEKLIDAEQKLNDAKGKLAQAEADYADAEKACDAAS
jgi:hypothetical protein